MADLPQPELVFGGKGACPDCGERCIELPAPLPEVGDDFDWRLRDYDRFRLFMLQELAARFPERQRWAPADMEVVLVEVLAAVLDQLSDMLDRVAEERFLESARRPESVRRLLQLIGYDAVRLAKARHQITEAIAGKLEDLWLRSPHFMEEARRDGPRAIHTQHRMVTMDDYGARMEDHPVVRRAHAWSHWTGSWTTVQVAVVAWDNRLLDYLGPYPEELRTAIKEFHNERELALPDLHAPVTVRAVLRPYLDAYRLLGREVVLEDAVPVGISLAISIQVAADFYQSEIRLAARQTLGTGPGGFFEPGRLAFGQDLHASDIFEALMGLDGVESVCLNRFKRLGSQCPDQVASGRITLEGLELAVCDNDPAQPARGYYRLTLHGGLNG